jgi:hypothetical protein
MLQVVGVNKVSVFQLQMLCLLEPASVLIQQALHYFQTIQQSPHAILSKIVVVFHSTFCSTVFKLFFSLMKYFNVVQLCKLHLWFILNPEAFPSKVLHCPAGRYGLL